MKKILQNIGTILMALLVLLSSLSFNVIEHYCGGEVADVSYFLDADCCGIELETDTCHPFSNKHLAKKKSCCFTKQNFVDGGEFPSHELQDFSQDLDLLTVECSAIPSFLFEDAFSRNRVTSYYSPPQLSIDTVVLFESYLI